MTREWGLPPRQLLLAGDGHWWISLDYRQRNDPEVWWLDTGIDDGLRLAPNFDDFLSGLRPESDVDPERGVLSPGRLA
ncbi:MAG: SMI1/KNR4 family protein [Deltaproteobacteria bacterium]|nr:MAG: SMI1/KNR4 family protein [Deltaproteobacteria bacterium]